MDPSMPGTNGLDAIREVMRRSPETKILVLTVHKTEEYVHASIKAGADGYILKEANYLELLMAIQNVLAGKRYLSPEISQNVIDGYLEGREFIENDPVWNSLTVREREVLKLSLFNTILV
jgi:two-component system, NarL family, response regulator NreC